MCGHQYDKQESEIEMDITPFVACHRPKLLYVFSAGAFVEEPASSSGAGRQDELDNNSCADKAQQVNKAGQINDEIQ